MLTAEIARNIWDYNPNTGHFYWKCNPSRSVVAGDRAGNFDGKYWRLQYKGKMYKASRVAWLYMTGSWPSEQIDHIDNDKRNDAFRNLREATNAENCRNRRCRSDNALGLKGVHQTKQGFVAQLFMSGKYVFTGVYASPEEAKLAYDTAAAQFHGVYARTR